MLNAIDVANSMARPVSGFDPQPSPSGGCSLVVPLYVGWNPAGLSLQAWESKVVSPSMYSVCLVETTNATPHLDVISGLVLRSLAVTGIWRNLELNE